MNFFQNIMIYENFSCSHYFVLILNCEYTLSVSVKRDFVYFIKCIFYLLHTVLCLRQISIITTTTIDLARAGSDDSMSTPGSAGLGFDPRRSSKFAFENFQPRGLEGWRFTLYNRYIVHHLPGLNSKPFRSIYVEKAYITVDSDSSVGWGR